MRSDTTMIMILDKKIMNPDISYAEIAKSLNCTKQNVMYHLRMAIRLFPFLKEYIKVNSSYNPGRDGLFLRYGDRKLNKASEIAIRLGESIDKIIKRYEDEKERKVNENVKDAIVKKTEKSIKEIAEKYKPKIDNVDEDEKEWVEQLTSKEDLSWVARLKVINKERLNMKLRRGE